MSQPHKRELVQRARELRKIATTQERKLWYLFLSKYTVRFQRQIVVKGFVVDFYCAKALLIIDLDGSPNFTEQGISFDTERTNVLRGLGIEVIRYTNNEVEHEFEKVCQEIGIVAQKRISEIESHLQKFSVPPS